MNNHSLSTIHEAHSPVKQPPSLTMLVGSLREVFRTHVYNESRGHKGHGDPVTKFFLPRPFRRVSKVVACGVFNVFPGAEGDHRPLILFGGSYRTIHDQCVVCSG